MIVIEEDNTETATGLSHTNQVGFVADANGKIHYKKKVVGKDGKVTYEDAKGVTVIADNYYYFNDDGTMVTGLAEIDGNTYYFAEFGLVGSLQTGFVTVNGQMYFCDPANGGVATRVQ